MYPVCFLFLALFFSIKLGKIRFSTIFALLFDSSSSSKVSLYSIFDYLIQYKNSLILQNIWLFSPILQWPTHTQKGWIEKILQYSTMLPRSALMPSRRRICGACGAIYTTTTRRVRGSRATIWPLLGMLLATKLMMRTFFLGSPIFCTIDVLCEKERERQGHRQLGWAVTWVRPIWLIRGCITRRYYHNHLHQLVLWPLSVHLIKRTLHSFLTSSLFAHSAILIVRSD